MAPRPAGIVRDYPLSRLTTIRTGGPAELFARPGTIAGARAAARVGGGRGPRGRGRRLGVEPPDSGRGRPRTRRETGQGAEQDRAGRARASQCGGGARLPAVSARAAQAGLTGIEFGVNIPGTVGGAVRMNANAYGGELARVLEWVDVVSARGTERRAPGAARLLLPALEPERRARSSPGRRFALARASQRRGQGDAGRHAQPAQGRPAIGDQDVRLDVQEPDRSTRRGPDGRTAARGRRVPRAAGRRRRLLREARELRREPRRGDHGRRDRR